MNNKAKARLYIGTMFFPYGKGEKNVIMQELPFLKEKFQVTILSSATDIVFNDKENETFLNDVDVIRVDYTKVHFKILKGLKILFNPIAFKEILTIIRCKKNVIQRIYESLMFFIYAQNFADKLHDIIEPGEESILYSFWYNVQTMGAVLVKKKYPKMKIVTRAHGFDLYNERYAGGRQPYKIWMDKKIDRIMFICDTGKKYYINTFAKEDSNRYIVERLGTSDKGIEGPKNNSGIFQIVSCSSIIPLKRVHLIAEAISDLPDAYKINWIHFGGGSEQKEVEDIARKLFDEKSNVSYRFTGYVENQKIAEYYQNNPVDIFISTSETEGLPISMQEAIAYGIILVATDVGGVHELIHENGVLLPANPRVKDISCAIKKIYNLGQSDREQMRRNSIDLWHRYYNASKNSEKMAQMLEKMV